MVFRALLNSLSYFLCLIFLCFTNFGCPGLYIAARSTPGALPRPSWRLELYWSSSPISSYYLSTIGVLVPLGLFIAFFNLCGSSGPCFVPQVAQSLAVVSASLRRRADDFWRFFYNLLFDFKYKLSRFGSFTGVSSFILELNTVALVACFSVPVLLKTLSGCLDAPKLVAVLLAFLRVCTCYLGTLNTSSFS